MGNINTCNIMLWSNTWWNISTNCRYFRPKWWTNQQTSAYWPTCPSTTISGCLTQKCCAVAVKVIWKHNELQQRSSVIISMQRFRKKQQRRRIIWFSFLQREHRLTNQHTEFRLVLLIVSVVCTNKDYTEAQNLKNRMWTNTADSSRP